MAMASRMKITEAPMNRRCRPMNSMLWSGLMSSKNLAMSNTQRSRPLTADQEVKHHPRQPHRGEQVADDARHEGDGEAADRAGSVGEEHHARHQVGDVGVEHRPEGAAEAGLDGAARRLAGAQLLADALVDDD